MTATATPRDAVTRDVVKAAGVTPEVAVTAATWDVAATAATTDMATAVATAATTTTTTTDVMKIVASFLLYTT